MAHPPGYDPEKAMAQVRQVELDALKRLAYCVDGMLDAENQGNHGDAREWKRHVRQAHETYDDLVNSDYS